MWRVGELPPLLLDDFSDAPAFSSPKPMPQKARGTHKAIADASLEQEQLTRTKAKLSLHLIASEETRRTKVPAIGGDKPSPIAASIRFLRRKRDRSASVSAIPPVPRLPIATDSPMQANAAPPSEPLPTNIRRMFAIRPAVLRRARSRPSLDQLPPSPPNRSNSWKRRKAPARLELARDSAIVGMSSVASTPTSTPIAATQQQTGVPLVRTDTLDSLASSVLEFAAPPVSSSGGTVGRYQSTLAQDPDEPVALEDGNWAQAFEPRRSGSLRKMARRLGIGTDTPFPAPSCSVPNPPSDPGQAPPPLPTRSPARMTRQSRRWSISSFASSMHDNRTAANTGSSDESGAETETEQGHEESYERHRDEKPKHPISDCNDSQDGAMLVVPSNAATMLRAEYWNPPRLFSGNRDKGKTYNTVGAQSWYGEWNRRDIRDVISSLRELK